MNTLSFTLDFLSYTLRFTWDGPTGSSTQQRARRDTIQNICGPKALDTRGLSAVVGDPNAQIAIVTLEDVPTNTYSRLPPQLQKFLYLRPPLSNRRMPSREAGFYIFHRNQPCVLQYICLSRDLVGLDLGRYLFTSYEQWIRTTYPVRCSRIFLASIDNPHVVDFYAGRGCAIERESDGTPIRGPISVNFVDELGHNIHVELANDTVLMTKQLHDGEGRVHSMDLTEDRGADRDEDRDDDRDNDRGADRDDDRGADRDDDLHIQMIGTELLIDANASQPLSMTM